MTIPSGNMFRQGEKRREFDRGSTLRSMDTDTCISVGRIQYEDAAFFQKKSRYVDTFLSFLS